MTYSNVLFLFQHSLKPQDFQCTSIQYDKEKEQFTGLRLYQFMIGEKNMQRKKATSPDIREKTQSKDQSLLQ